LLAQEGGVARGQLDGFGQQQFLGGRLVVVLEPGEHLLEEYPFVRGVLVQQHQSAVGFKHDVKFTDRNLLFARPPVLGAARVSANGDGGLATAAVESVTDGGGSAVVVRERMRGRAGDLLERSV
jgi:hypothetical protein